MDKRIGKANKKRKKGKVNRVRYEEVNGQGMKKAGKGYPSPRGVPSSKAARRPIRVIRLL